MKSLIFLTIQTKTTFGLILDSSVSFRFSRPANVRPCDWSPAFPFASAGPHFLLFPVHSVVSTIAQVNLLKCKQMISAENLPPKFTQTLPVPTYFTQGKSHCFFNVVFCEASSFILFALFNHDGLFAAP